MQHVSVCQTNVTLHSGSLTREKGGGEKHHIGREEWCICSYWADFWTDGCICPLIHPPFTHQPFPYRLRKTYLWEMPLWCWCLRLSVYVYGSLYMSTFYWLWAGYSSFSQQKNHWGHTKSLWVCQEKLFWSCTIDQVWCRYWSGIPKCSFFFTGNTSKILIQQLSLEHCIWFLAHQRWLIS